ncbi:MAG: CCA tRNA nucleotidyltransferase [Phycisphaerae bacterium]
MSNAAAEKAALWVVRTLREAGYQALFAGGCVRDMLLGRPSNDYDVATDATPDDVKSLFGRVLLVGAQFGVAIVLKGGRQVEVATFRSDVSYSDGRRPDRVEYSSPEEDAHRRDFTINGMFYDPIAETVIDYVDGQADLERGLVRTIGTPEDRFAEDYLRMLRAVRFTVRLGFHLDEVTADAIAGQAASIERISGERIFDELSKMLSHAGAPDALELMHRLRLAEHVLGELLDGDRGPARWQAGLQRVRDLADREDLLLTLAALTCELPSRAISTMTRRWGTSNEFRDGLQWLGEHADDWTRADELTLADLKRLRASQHCSRLEPLMWTREMQVTGEATATRALWARAWDIPPETVQPRPWVTGQDVMAMGLREGPAIGAVLHSLYEEQLNEQLTSRSEALEQARRYVAQIISLL